MYSSDFPTLVEFLPLFPFLVDNLLNWAFLSLPKVCQYAALVRITTRKLCGCDLQKASSPVARGFRAPAKNHCSPIKHTNPLNLLEKLFSCLKHNAIVNFYVNQ